MVRVWQGFFSVLWLSYASKRTNERTRKSKICTHTHTILAFEFIHPELRIIRLFIWHKRKRHILLFKFIFNLSVVCFNSGACVKFNLEVDGKYRRNFWIKKMPHSNIFLWYDFVFRNFCTFGWRLLSKELLVFARSLSRIQLDLMNMWWYVFCLVFREVPIKKIFHIIIKGFIEN